VLRGVGRRATALTIDRAQAVLLHAQGLTRGARRFVGLACAGLALATAAFAASAQAPSDTPSLALPVRCTPGVECFVQNYVDHDPGPGWRDYACGHLAYDKHHGTDFRVRSLADMERGVDVLAAADGVVVATRDGEPDVDVRERGVENLRGRDAGNGVRIDHGGGWETQYSHLRRGSVRVHRGQRVSAGEVLGQIGLSGRTEFPHLDLVVRHHGVPVDPFAPATAEPAGDASAACAQGPAPDSLWRPELRPALRYVPSGVLIAGFAGEKPDRRKAQQGGYQQALRTASSALVFWVEVFGPQAGDVERFEIVDPEGKVVLRRELKVDRDLAVRFTYAGRRRSDRPWEPGAYRGSYTLLRDGRVVAREEVSAPMR